jgi:Ca-activated chloride channel family protein
MNGIVSGVLAWRKAGLLAVEWGAPWLLLGLVVVVVAFGLALWLERARPTLRLARGDELRALPSSGHARTIALACGALAAALFAIAVAEPFVKGEPDPRTSEGIDIALALDVSGSMRAADFRPNDRLFVAKDVIKKNVLTRVRDRVGLVVFAGEAFTQAPLTHDKALLASVLDGVRTGVIKDGTAIGDGLALALARLETSKAKSRVVILISDGDNNSGELAPETAMAMAKELGVKTFTILVGKGGRVPFPDGVDIFGAPRFVTVEMPVNPTLLKTIAKETGGTFFQATDKKSLETSLQSILEALDKSQLEGAPPVRRPIPLGPLFALPGLLLLVVAAGLRFTKGSLVP